MRVWMYAVHSDDLNADLFAASIPPEDRAFDAASDVFPACVALRAQSAEIGKRSRARFKSLAASSNTSERVSRM